MVEQSSVAKYVAYVVEGFFRYTRIDNRGNEHIVGYVFKGEYVGDYASLIKKDITSLVTVQAVTDCKIYYVPLEEVRKFSIRMKMHKLQDVFLRKSYSWWHTHVY